MKKLIRILVTAACAVVLLCMPLCVSAGSSLTVGAGGAYPTISDAYNAAGDGDTITLLGDITENVSIKLSTDKTVTIDGQGHTLKGISNNNDYTVPRALWVSGNGTVFLKDITITAGDGSSSRKGGGPDTVSIFDCSVGLFVENKASVIGKDNVSVTGGCAPSDFSRTYGVYNAGIGTVNVGAATGGSTGNGGESYGVYNESSGTINVKTATGGAGNNGISYAAANLGAGTVNVASAAGGSGNICAGVYNKSAGTVNAGAATSPDAQSSNGVINDDTGTVNVETATCGKTPVFQCSGVQNDEYGTVNVKSFTQGTSGVPCNTDVKTLTLHIEDGAFCVLSTITVAADGKTAVGTLPGVLYNGKYYTDWYSDSAKTVKVLGETDASDLYSGCLSSQASGGTQAIKAQEPQLGAQLHAEPQDSMENIKPQDSPASQAEALPAQEAKSPEQNGSLTLIIIIALACALVACAAIFIRKRRRPENR